MVPRAHRGIVGVSAVALLFFILLAAPPKVSANSVTDSTAAGGEVLRLPVAGSVANDNGVNSKPIEVPQETNLENRYRDAAGPVRAADSRYEMQVEGALGSVDFTAGYRLSPATSGECPVGSDGTSSSTGEAVNTGSGSLVNGSEGTPAADPGAFNVAGCIDQLPIMSNGTVIKISWTVRIQILSGSGEPIYGASVRVFDALGNLVAFVLTDMNGMTPPLRLSQLTVDSDGTTVHNPYTVQVEAGGETVQFGMSVESNRLFTFVIELPAGGEPLFLTLNVAVAVLGLFFASAFSMERSRLALLSPLIPLYTRVRREDIVGQHTRGMILAYLDSNPGEHFGAIKRALSLTNGNAMYHLRFLEKEGLVKARFDGMLKRYYPRWMNVPPEGNGHLLEVQEQT